MFWYEFHEVCSYGPIEIKSWLVLFMSSLESLTETMIIYRKWDLLEHQLTANSPERHLSAKSKIVFLFLLSQLRVAFTGTIWHNEHIATPKCIMKFWFCRLNGIIQHTGYTYVLVIYFVTPSLFAKYLPLTWWTCRASFQIQQPGAQWAAGYTRLLHSLHSWW